MRAVSLPEKCKDTWEHCFFFPKNSFISRSCLLNWEDKVITMTNGPLERSASTTAPMGKCKTRLDLCLPRKPSTWDLYDVFSWPHLQREDAQVFRSPVKMSRKAHVPNVTGRVFTSVPPPTLPPLLSHNGSHVTWDLGQLHACKNPPSLPKTPHTPYTTYSHFLLFHSSEELGQLEQTSLRETSLSVFRVTPSTIQVMIGSD